MNSISNDVNGFRWYLLGKEDSSIPDPRTVEPIGGAEVCELKFWLELDSTKTIPTETCIQTKIIEWIKKQI